MAIRSYSLPEVLVLRILPFLSSLIWPSKLFCFLKCSSGLPVLEISCFPLGSSCTLFSTFISDTLFFTLVKVFRSVLLMLSTLIAGGGGAFLFDCFNLSSFSESVESNVQTFLLLTLWDRPYDALWSVS